MAKTGLEHAKGQEYAYASVLGQNKKHYEKKKRRVVLLKLLKNWTIHMLGKC